MSGFSSGRCALSTAFSLLVTFQAPAHAQATSDYGRGVEARLDGRIDSAVELLARAVSAEPRNADAQLQYGLSLLAAGRLDEAERAFRTTLELAPDYADARLGLARVHQRRGERAAALAELEQVAVTNPEVSDLRAALMRPSVAGAGYRWRVDLDGSYSDVRAEQDWRDLSLRITGALDPATKVGAGIEHSHRFGEQDTFGELRIDHRLSDRSNVWLSAGATPDADFRPRWQVGGGGGFKLSQGPSATVATIDARHASYRTGDIQILNPGVEQYIPGGHWVTARMINVVGDGDWHSGWLVRADIAAANRLRLFGGVADAPDVTEGVVVETLSLFGGLAVDLNNRTTLRLFVNSEDRDGSADRIEISTGFGIRF